VVRHDQEIDTGKCDSCQQFGFRFAAKVPRKQHTKSIYLDMGHQRTVISRAKIGIGRGPESGQSQVTVFDCRIARGSLDDGHSAPPGSRDEVPERIVGASSPWEPQLPNGDRLENRRQASPVIRIGVGSDHEIEPPHAERPKSRNDYAFAEVSRASQPPPPIDENRGSAALNHDRVALPDIEHHHPGQRFGIGVGGKHRQRAYRTEGSKNTSARAAQ